MSATSLVQALQLVLQDAVPDANVVLGIPKLIHDPILVYLWRDGSPTDVVKTTSTVRRYHQIHIHLLVQSSGDDANAELLYLDLSDRISDVFQANRRLLGTAVNSTITPKVLGSQYVLVDGAEFRACAWLWTAAEQFTFQFA